MIRRPGRDERRAEDSCEAASRCCCPAPVLLLAAPPRSRAARAAVPGRAVSYPRAFESAPRRCQMLWHTLYELYVPSYL